MREYHRSEASFEKYRSRIILMGLFVFLFHGAKLNSNIIGIDTEDIIKLQGDFYGGWLTTGRQGLVFLKGLLGTLQFNPYFAGLLTLVFLIAAAVAFLGLWDRTGIDNGQRSSYAGWFLGGLLWISHPILTEQLYFSLQSAEICVGLLITAIALFLTMKGGRNRQPICFAASILLLLLAFSLYQVFVVIYIFGTLTLLLLEGISGETADYKEILRRQLFPHAAVFLAAFVLNMLVTKAFFSSSDYLQGQILWNSGDIISNFRAILGHMAKVCTGYGSIYYSLGYGVLCLFTTVLFLLVLKKKRQPIGGNLLQLFFLAALFFTPFLMTMVCGGAPVVRSQLVLPVMTGFLGYFDLRLWGMLREMERRTLLIRAIAVCIGTICLLTGLMQLQVTTRLYYTDRVRYEQDAALGRELIDRIEQVRGREQYPLIVIGRKEFEGNHACVLGEVTGRSFFDYDTEVEPAFFWSTRRIIGFLHSLGKEYAMISQDRLEEAMEYSTYMPEWPAKNSVQVHEGMLIIKLSHFED